LKDYQKFLESELLPRANGEWAIGTEKFARKLELELDAAMGADKVMADAESEFARVARDMYVWRASFGAALLEAAAAAG